jgi:bifunctional non-homologous end joining protein LigD
MYAFDVLRIDGRDVTGLPLRERRELLEGVLIPDGVVRLSVAFDDGAALLDQAVELGLEGVIAKRPASRYLPGRRSDSWVKVKTQQRQELIIAGYTRGQGRREGAFGALVLAIERGEELVWAGNCGTGFDDAELDMLIAKLEPLRRETSPLAVTPRMAKVRAADVTWVEPELVCEVVFLEWTREGRLRAPSYKGLRDDKEARDVHREHPRKQSAGTPRRPLELSNLDKVFWPDEGITKGDLLRYYRAIAPVLVPHLRGRPFTMRRYPDGAYGKAFFQKQSPSHMPDWIATYRALVSTREGSGAKKWVDFPIVNDELALLWMVNMGCIDLNTWYSRVDKPDRPDFVLFDLDPTPEVPWSQTAEVALILKELLDALELASFPKTSGGKGFHVLVPIDRRSTFEDTRAFAEHVAGAIARTHPKLATTEWSKARRRGVLIDSNQNGEGKTIASVYSVRPKPGAPVSTPLVWSEVNDRLNPSIYTMDVVLERVRAKGDLYEGVMTTHQSLSKALKRLA